MTSTVWTPKTVNRPTPDGFAVLAIKAEWNQRQDLLSFKVDGDRHCWHRRSAPLFQSRKACVEWAREQGWPLG